MDALRRELDQLEHAGRRRHTEAWPEAGGHIRLPQGRTLLNFSSNDYLGLARDPQVCQRAIQAIEQWGCGSTGSRLMSGTLCLHEELEAALARLTGRETALVFSSGFGMNTGLVAALAGRDDTLFCDRLNHASLVDGARLSGAVMRRYAHNDMTMLARLLETTPCKGRRLIVCESVFSMDGDIAPLAEIQRLARTHNAFLVVDEAHAIGVWGQGGGVCREDDLRVQPDITVGTLGKALGSLGGFAAASALLRDYLINRARSFIYATALPPSCLGAALGAIERLQADPGMGARLLARARVFHDQLQAEGLRLAAFQTQIIPVLIGDNAPALAMAQRLREKGLLVTAVRPPTVPSGTARLRLSVTLSHTPDELAWAARIIGETARAIGLI